MLRFPFRQLSTASLLRKLNRELKFPEVIHQARYAEDPKTAQPELQHAATQLALEKGLAPPVQPRGDSPTNPLYIHMLGEETQQTFSFANFFGKALYKVVNMVLLGFLTAFVYRQLQVTSPNTESKSHQMGVSEKTFKDVRGIDECRSELEELVEYLKNPEKFHSVGAKVPKGVLLTGEPGTGKTLLAKAIAGEAGVQFFFSSGSDFEEVFVGLGSKRIRQLFADARKSAPCLVFIDEIDALGGSRKNEKFAYSRQSLNQLLVEMDGFDQKDNVIVIAATNQPRLLDNALKRAGRFDKEIAVPLPDIKGREDIFHLYLDRVYHDESIDIPKLAKSTTGVTGADISNIVNTAVIHAVEQARGVCTQEDIDFAIDRLSMGVERRTLMSEQEKKNTAVHELGHTLAALLTPNTMKVRKVTILSRGQALGFTSFLGTEATEAETKEKVQAHFDICMGGRVAEEMFYGTDNINTGCTADLRSASKLAYSHLRGGMFQDLVGVANTRELKTLGGEYESQLDDFAEQLLTASYRRTAKKLQPYRQLIDSLSEELVRKETMTDVELKDWLKRYYADSPSTLQLFVGL